jgi:hypothetical protein
MFYNYLKNLYTIIDNRDENQIIKFTKFNRNLIKALKLGPSYFDYDQNQSGGASSNFESTLLAIFASIGEGINKLKKSGVDTTELSVLLRTYSSILSLYKIYITRLIEEHQLVKNEVTDLENKISNSSLKDLNKTIEDIQTNINQIIGPA